MVLTRRVSVATNSSAVTNSEEICCQENATQKPTGPRSRLRSALTFAEDLRLLLNRRMRTREYSGVVATVTNGGGYPILSSF